MILDANAQFNLKLRYHLMVLQIKSSTVNHSRRKERNYRILTCLPIFMSVSIWNQLKYKQDICSSFQIIAIEQRIQMWKLKYHTEDKKRSSWIFFSTFKHLACPVSVSSAGFYVVWVRWHLAGGHLCVSTNVRLLAWICGCFLGGSRHLCCTCQGVYSSCQPQFIHFHKLA